MNQMGTAVTAACHISKHVIFSANGVKCQSRQSRQSHSHAGLKSSRSGDANPTASSCLVDVHKVDAVPYPTPDVL